MSGYTDDRLSRISAMVQELERGLTASRHHLQRMLEFERESIKDDWLPEHRQIAREAVEHARQDVRDAEAALAEGARIFEEFSNAVFGG